MNAAASSWASGAISQCLSSVTSRSTTRRPARFTGRSGLRWVRPFSLRAPRSAARRPGPRAERAPHRGAGAPACLRPRPRSSAAVLSWTGRARLDRRAFHLRRLVAFVGAEVLPDREEFGRQGGDAAVFEGTDSAFGHARAAGDVDN